METKEFKIQVPEGYEIDTENSTFECIKFKPIKKDITYEDIADSLFCNNYLYISNYGEIEFSEDCGSESYHKSNARDKKQLERLLALNQLLNIAEYYNRQHPKNKDPYCITFKNEEGYKSFRYDLDDNLFGVVALFNKYEDAQAVIDNPNFRDILDTIYKVK